jgi:hypothetical protein
MDRRARFTTSVKCPKCERTGTAILKKMQTPCTAGVIWALHLEARPLDFERLAGGLLRHMRRKRDWRLEFKLGHYLATKSLDKTSRNL